MSSDKMFEVVEGSIFVFGEEISRSKEKPWLFSLTHIHRLLKDKWERVKPVKAWSSAQPNKWWLNNDTGEVYPYIKKECREKTPEARRDIEFWGNSHSQEPGSELSYDQILGRKHMKMEDVLYTVNGGRHSGTFASRLLVISYLRFISPKFSAYVDKVFLRYMDGDEDLHEEIRENKVKTRLDMPKPLQKAMKGITLDYTNTFQHLGCSMPKMYNNTWKGLTGKGVNDQGVPKPVRDNIDALTYSKLIQSEAQQIGIARNEKGKITTAQAYRNARLSGEYMRANAISTSEGLLQALEENNNVARYFPGLDIQDIPSHTLHVLKFALCGSHKDVEVAKTAVRESGLPLAKRKEIMLWYRERNRVLAMGTKKPKDN